MKNLAEGHISGFLIFCLEYQVFLGILLVWRTTQNPAASAPYLRDWLLVLSIFSNPVAAIVGAIVAKWSSGEKGGEDKR